MSDDASMRVTKGSPVYPQVKQAIGKMGRDISLARRSRRIPAEDFAAQMGVSRTTLHRLETGDPGVSLNTLSMAMHVLGRLDTIADLADPAKDDVGLMMARQGAPQRIQRSRGHRPRVAPAGASADGAEPQGEPVAQDNGFVGF